MFKMTDRNRINVSEKIWDSTFDHIGPVGISVLGPVKEDLKTKIDPDQYRFWVDPIQAGNVIECTDGGRPTLVLRVPEDLSVDWFANRHGDSVLESCQRAMPVDNGWNLEFRPDPGLVSSADIEEIRAGRSGKSNDASRVVSIDGLDLTLDRDLTFANFLEFPGNAFAYRACKATADDINGKGGLWFIHGGVGGGKTHLLHAVGNEALKKNGNVVMCLPAPTLAAAATKTERGGKRDYTAINALRQVVPSVDVLLIDSVDSLLRREWTQEQLSFWLESLARQHKQVVVTSENPAIESSDYSALRSRFTEAVPLYVEGIGAKDKFDVLKYWRHTGSHEIRDDVLDVMAKRLTTNLRILKGAYTHVVSHQSLMGETLEPGEKLDRLLADHSTIEFSPSLARGVVSTKYGLVGNEIDTPGRDKRYMVPRDIAMYLCEQKGMSYNSIGRAFPDSKTHKQRTHITARDACDRVRAKMDKNQEFRREVNSLKGEAAVA
jgi:chromosomal replication initiator protein